jgi:two-component system CheB/CheR fusion protein
MRNGEKPEKSTGRIEELEARLWEAEETLRAIHSGEVDALVISGPEEGEQIYTLRTAEHPYRVLVEAMSEGAVTLDHEGTILYCNQSFADLLKTPSEKVLGSTLGQFIAPADRPRYEALLRQCRQKSAKGEITLIAGSESEVPAHLSLSPLLLEDLQGMSIVVTDLTEQKRQQELVASAKLLRSILDQAAEATVVCDERGQIIHASRRAHELCACNPVLLPFDEALPLCRSIEGNGAAQEALTFSAILEGKELRGVEATFHRPDGHVFSLLMSAGLVLDLKGKMLGCVVTLIDITERKRAEKELQFQALVLSQINDAVVAIDDQQRITYLNQAAERQYGLQAAQALNRPLQEFYEYRWASSGEEASADDSLARLGSWRGENVHIRQDGATLFVESAVSTLKDEAGRVTGLLGVIRDITERVKAAKEVERRYKDRIKLTETNRALVGTFDFDQVTDVICRAARDLTGADGATFVLREGQRVRYAAESAIAPLWKGQSFPIDCCISGWAMLHAESVAIEDIYADHRIPHGAYGPTFVKSLLMTPVGPGTPVASIGVYWAQQHRASDYEVELLQSLASAADLALAGVRVYEQARQAWAEAEQANRLKDEFLATLSHELRNPLNSIVGHANVLLRSPEAKQLTAVRHSAETIHRNAEAQAQLINDLLDLSRLQTGKLAVDRQPTSLAHVLNDVVESVRTQAAAKELKLDMNFPAGQLIVNADPVRVQQVAWNLINNAVKFTPKGGRVSLTLCRDGEEAKLDVEDTGQGIDPAFLPHVFEMFRQYDAGTTRPHGGMGIGLALVRQLVELHGGRVEAYSEGPGRGARFTVRFPLQQIVDFEPCVPVVAGAENGLCGARVLIMDDSQDSLEMLRLLLTFEGAVVTTAVNGEEGLRLARREEFDLIVSDISMPMMDGYDFLKNLRAEQLRYASVPAIALTGFGRDEDVKRAQQAGFTTHLTKPLDFDRLLQLARGALRK